MPKLFQSVPVIDRFLLISARLNPQQSRINSHVGIRTYRIVLVMGQAFRAHRIPMWAQIVAPVWDVKMKGLD